MSAKKPDPLISAKTHERCPVCGEISYSVGGVHPQCAVRQADAKRMKRVNRGERTRRAAKPVDGIKAWQKICPKCNASQHVRKKECDCGHTFVVRGAETTRNG
ncbi:MAG: hypothetical protein AB7I48_18135, partial [Planctomycetaceae bacterium]